MHERADCDPRRMVLVPALEGFRPWALLCTHVGAHSHSCARHVSASAPPPSLFLSLCARDISGNRELYAVQGFSMQYRRIAQPREPSEF